MSDLHLRSDMKVIELAQPLVEDLGDLKSREVDFIVVSGDLTDRGSPEGMERAREFLSELIKRCGLTAERCLLVPGNHDVNQKTTVYHYRAGVSAEGARAMPHVQQGAVYLIRDDDRYPTRFEEFRKCHHQLKQTEYPLRHQEQGLLLPFPEFGIEFLLLNSAWEVDEFYPKRCSINPEALAHTLQNLGPPNGMLRMTVWHHAVSGNDKIQDEYYVSRLVAARFRVCLHGDVHEPRAALRNHLDPGKTIHVVGVGSFAAEAKDRPESVPRMYNLLEVNRDLSKIRVRVRKQERPNEAFKPFPIRETSPSEMCDWYDIVL